MQKLVAILVCLTTLHPAIAGESDGTLDIWFIDVEGGAATLIVTPAGESLLIDSGYPDNNGRDRKRILTTLQERAGLKRLDHAIVSHWHMDHYGNHAALAAEVPIGRFWDRGIPDELREDKAFPERIAEYRRASQNASRPLHAGDAIPLRQTATPLTLRVLTSGREVVPNRGQENPFAGEHQPKAEDPTDNAASLSLLLEYGNFRFLTCGDLTWNIEARLVTPANPVGQVDVFMVTHHGLPASNNPALVLAIDPVVTVMCNGPRKGGHPETLRTLRRIKSLQQMYQLHRNITIDSAMQAPAENIANSGPASECAGRGITLRVQPDSQRYTVRIDGSSSQRSFDTRLPRRLQ